MGGSELKEESENKCLSERVRELRTTGPMNLTALSLRDFLPILGTRKMRISAADIEMKQLRVVWRSCTRNNVEADESYFVLNPAADW